MRVVRVCSMACLDESRIQYAGGRRRGAAAMVLTSEQSRKFEAHEPFRTIVYERPRMIGWAMTGCER